MTSYAPNELHYKYSASSERLAVFSEIYYPDGWTSPFCPRTGPGHIRPKQTPPFRADWTLRAALLPAGEHELVMTFLPESYRTGALRLPHCLHRPVAAPASVRRPRLLLG